MCYVTCKSHTQVKHELSLANKIKRKDEIIQTRNIQIATLWQELHEQQPWRNALDTPSRITFDGVEDVCVWGGWVMM